MASKELAIGLKHTRSERKDDTSREAFVMPLFQKTHAALAAQSKPQKPRFEHHLRSAVNDFDEQHEFGTLPLASSLRRESISFERPGTGRPGARSTTRTTESSRATSRLGESWAGRSRRWHGMAGECCPPRRLVRCRWLRPRRAETLTVKFNTTGTSHIS